MAYEKKPESGALFKNDRKEKDSHPDYKGDALIDGKLWWVSAWINESKSGTKYMSMSFKLKEPMNSPAPEPATPSAANAGSDFEPDSEIPF